jgi:hypothetical protein
MSRGSKSIGWPAGDAREAGGAASVGGELGSADFFLGERLWLEEASGVSSEEGRARLWGCKGLADMASSKPDRGRFPACDAPAPDVCGGAGWGPTAGRGWPILGESGFISTSFLRPVSRHLTVVVSNDGWGLQTRKKSAKSEETHKTEGKH